MSLNVFAFYTFYRYVIDVELSNNNWFSNWRFCFFIIQIKIYSA
jgi:hypothetical protein